MSAGGKHAAVAACSHDREPISIPGFHHDSKRFSLRCPNEKRIAPCRDRQN